MRVIIRYDVAINFANVIADRHTHLPWLVSRSVVDTLYWTETVTTSRPNVVDDVDEVCVLMRLVVYSRGVVYVELMSATEQRKKRVRGLSRLVLSHDSQRGWLGRADEGGIAGERVREGGGRDAERGGGNIYACVGRQYSRVRKQGRRFEGIRDVFEGTRAVRNS